MSKKTHSIFILLLIVITLSVYYNSFSNSFAYDDYALVVNNPSTKQLSAGNLAYYFTDRNTASADAELSRDNWRPFVTTSFAVDYKLWKLKPRFYHIENTVFHLLNIIMVYAAGVLILNSGLAAFIGGLVFAIHPVQTEAVTWISGRSNVLFLLFFLSAFLFHVRNRKYGYKTLNYSLLLVLFTLGILSKEMAVTLPAVLIIYDLHFYPRKSFKSYLLYYLPFFLICIFYFITRFFVLDSVAQQAGWWGGSIFSNMLMTLKAVGGYIRLLILPTNLGIEYPPDVSRYMLYRGALGAAISVFIVGFIWFSKRRERKIAFYMAWFFVTFIPVYNIVPVKAIMAERFLYLPMIAFASLSGIFFSGLMSRCKGIAAKTAISLMITSIFIFYASYVVSRNGQWKDELTLYAKEVSRLPDNPRSHYNLAFAYAKAARIAGSKDLSGSYYASSIKEFNETLRLKPEYYLAYFAYANLGDVYNETGQHALAVENFKKARALRESRDSYNNLALLYFEKGDYGEAAKYCKSAVLINPDDMNAYINLGNVYFVTGQRAKAKRAYLKAARLRGGDPKLVKSINEL